MHRRGFVRTGRAARPRPSAPAAGCSAPSISPCRTGSAPRCCGALAADGSLIQVTRAATADKARLARIAQDEAATVTFGVDVEGLPRLG